MPETAVARPTLDGWSRLSWTDGVQIDALAPLDAIFVRTRNTLYELVVRSPIQGDVLVRGGRFFPSFTPVRVSGCSLRGACLKLRGVYVGFFLELEYDGRTVLTTRIQSVDRVTRHTLQ